MYWNAFKDSWKRLFRNPILLLPDFIFFIFFVIGGYSILKSFGILDIFIEKNTEQLIALLSNFNQLMGLMVSVVIFVIVSFFLGASTLSWKYAMIRNKILNKKNSLWNDFKEGHKKIKSVIFMKILIFAIAVLALFIGILLVASGKYFGNYLPSLIVVAILEMIFFILFYVFIFFRYPIMFFKNYNAVNSLKESFQLGRKRYDAVIIAALFIIFIGILFSLFINLIGLIKSFVLTQVISAVIGLFIEVWDDLFLFDIFHRIRKKN